MRRAKRSRDLILGLLCFLVCIIGSPCLVYAKAGETPVSQLIELSPEEQAYIEDNRRVDVMFAEGIAPLAYMDDNGEAAGILKELLNVIERKTGFQFQYRQGESTEGITRSMINGDIDMIGSIPVQYLAEELEDYPRSKPFLTSETVLMIHIGVDASDVWEAVYAAVRGSELPEGVNPDTAKYYDSREAAMNAVEEGEADYCYANEFSITYCTIKNGYQNVMSVPQGKESREYFLVYSREDPMLAAIMDRALDSISQQEMQYLILKGTSDVSRSVSFFIIMNRYGVEIACVVGVVIFAMAIMLIFVCRSGKKIQIENQRYQMLSDLSDEYIYEYRGNSDILALTEKCSHVLGMPMEIQQFSQSQYLNRQPGLGKLIDATQNGKEIHFSCGEKQKEFRIVNSALNMEHGGRGYIIGKLIDISEEKEKLHALLVKSQTDGLTGLLNPNTTRELIQKNCRNSRETNVLYIIDVDNFKVVNDTFGHDTGDKLLSRIGEALQENFRDTDIVGRIGGDEFGVFMQGDFSQDILIEKCEQLQSRIHKIKLPDSEAAVTLSIGVAVNMKNGAGYERLYKAADRALYEAKKNGRDRYCIRILNEGNGT